MSKENRRFRRQQKQRRPSSPKHLRKQMREFDQHGQHSKRETILRWWAGIFFGYAGLNLLSNVLFSLAGGGPKAVRDYFDSFQFIFSLATTYPWLFGPVALLVSSTALIGAVLIVMEVWQKFREHATQRKIYLEAVKETYQVIPLVIDPELKIPLPEPVYQRLSYLRKPAYSQEKGEKPSHISAKYIMDILEESQSVCVILLGDPGGGKTTFLRQSMFALAKQALKDESFPLPVYIALPSFAKFIAQDEQNAVKKYLQEKESLLMQMRITAFAEVMQSAVESGRVFLFLDSLDEVDPGMRQLVIDWVLKQQASASQGAVVLGTRFTDYDPVQFASGNRKLSPNQEFTELVAQLMDHDIRVNLATELFGPLKQQIEILFPAKARVLPQPDVEEFIVLIEQTAQQEALLGGNPLLFSLAAYLYVLGGRQTLPTSRITLYGTFIEALLTKVVDRRQQKAPAVRKMVLMNETLRVLAEVALWTFTHLDGAIDFTERMLVEALGDIKGKITLSGDAEQMATWVVDSGMLAVGERNDRYAFRHHTVQEYLVAVAFSKGILSTRLRKDTRELLHKKRFDPQWYEPMRMLAGVLVESEQDIPGAQQFAREWIDELAQIAMDTHQADHDAALELAVASLPEIPTMAVFGEKIPAAALLEAWAEALLRAAQAAQSEWLGRYQRLAKGVSLLPAVFVDPAMGRLQRALADDSQPAGQKAAAQVLEGLGSLVVDLGPLVRVVQSPAQRDVRIAAAHTLAVLELRDGDQRPAGYAVLAQALQGADAELAQIVAMALNGAGERARQLMNLAVEKQRDRETRRLGTIALGSLGRGAKHELEALSTDGVPIVAATAAAILQSLGESQEMLRARLVALAEHGEDVLVQLQSILPSSLRRLGYQVNVISGSEVIIPPMVTIPAGAFLMGSDKKKDSQARENELPQQTITVDEYAIGTYPLTVAEYACFVRATKRNPPQEDSYSHTTWAKQQERPDHPVVNITWQDALAYVQWLAQVTNQLYRMPTEAEWEKAARGTDGRIYPWGNQWDKTKANTYDGGPRSTTPVGSYPQGASPYGCMDMAGNVWQWTSTIYVAKYPYKNDIDHENNNSTNSRVLRGGSWNVYPGLARAAYRDFSTPDLFVGNWGGRVARARLSAGS